MVLWRKVKLVRRSEVAQRLVVLLAAGLEVGVGQVGKREHQGAVLSLHIPQFLVVFGDLGLELAHAGKDRSHILAGLFLQRDLLGDLVLLGLHGLRGRDQLPARHIQLQNPVHLRVAVHFLGPQARLDRRRVVFDPLDI